MTRIEPRDVAQAAIDDPTLPAGTDERFSGYGVMGLPFSSGHYLTVRHFPASSIGPGYTAVWHRDPHGRWQIFADAAPEFSCPRFFSSATAFPARTCAIEKSWSDSRTLTVTVPGAISWTLTIGGTGATRLMTAAGSMLSEGAWSDQTLLAAMSRIAGPVLSVGTVRLTGRVPNGQHFQFAPKRIWSIVSSSATINGKDAGAPGRLSRQTRMSDFWLPQHGIFAVGTARFETFDGSKHRAATELLPGLGVATGSIDGE
ncbi:MAG: hypothetical protein ABI275_02980 [Terrimesophilobacter sp.]